MNFGRGLAALGLVADDIVDFFADTKAEWQTAALGCYSFGFTVATTYANLGADALKYGINLTESFSSFPTPPSLSKTPRLFVK
jgi:long-subunit acyl-CoA synthetase (AMP-forming)